MRNIASPNAIAAGLMKPGKRNQEPRITPLGLFIIKGQFANTPDAENHKEMVIEFGRLLEAATTNGFKGSGELMTLFAAGSDPMRSPRLLELCRQAVGAIYA